MPTGVLSADLLSRMDAYWRAANYLSVGQIYLYDNPLLKRAAEALAREAAGGRALGHDAGPELHLRAPEPGHQEVRPRHVLHRRSRSWRPGARRQHLPRRHATARSIPNVSQDEAGLKKLFTQFSFPGGISSHVAPTTPGSIHEGGELGYSLSHAFGAAFDNPDLIVACVIGDGEAETGPLGDRLAVQQVPQPDHRRRGAADPAPQRLQDQQPDRPGPHRARGAGAVPARLRLDAPLRRRRRARGDASSSWPARWTRPSRRSGRSRAMHATTSDTTRPRWPMIVLRSPKGWTGPKVVDGLQIEGTFRAHQVPLLVDAEHPEHLEQLESWMRSYRPEELFDEDGRLDAGAGRAGARGRPADGRQPARQRRRPAARPAHARLPRPRRRRCRRPAPSTARTRSCWASSCATWRELNQEQRNFRIFGPDETLSNLLGAVFEVTNRQWDARTMRRTTSSSRPPDACSTRCSASTSARAGSRATCSPAGTGCSTATRRSSTSSTRCSTSTPSG